MPTSKLSNKSIGITIGDPGGIGPEVIAKALSKPSIRRLAQFKIIGDAHILKKRLKPLPKNCTLIDTASLSIKQWTLGKATQAGAKASLTYLDKAVAMLKNNEISALVTAPVCKETLSQIKSNFVGHTEYLAEHFDIKNAGMMFVSKNLRTIIVTRHVPLNKVSQSITTKNILETIQLTHKALREMFKIKNPRIGVCGLNPHAGEGGTLGLEEIKKIIPAIKKAKAKKINVHGPFAADTLFSSDTQSSYDTIVAMYHDQGLIPVKTLSFTKLVNLTIGLPFIRTSPAHGTAFDIAKQKRANPTSMCEAIKLAVKLS